MPLNQNSLSVFEKHSKHSSLGNVGTKTMTERKESLEEEMFQCVLNNQSSKVMSLLQKKSIDINWRNPQSNHKTALHVAVENSNAIIVALLLGKGADVSLKEDEYGKTALNIALEKDDKQIMDLVVNKALALLDDLTQQNRKLQSQGTLTKLEKVELSNKLLQLVDGPQESNSRFKTHLIRKSPLDELLRISHFQTVYNIFTAIFLIAVSNIFINNYLATGVILDFSLFVWVFSDFGNAVLFWFFLLCVSCFAYILQRAIVLESLTPKSAYIIYALILAGMYIITPYYVRVRAYPPATGFFIICEMIRLSMKMHSYIMVNYRLRKAKNQGDSDPSVADYPANVTFDNFFAYLWFPTLVYQTSYPRTEVIHLSYVIKRFGDVFSCFLFVYAIFVTYIIPISQEVNGDFKTLLLATFKLMLPGMLINLLGFYGILHSWLNAFAELTRFGDRHFYSDWWNATSWSVYYRKWNFVVHNFLHQHIFLDLMDAFHISKTFALWVTFILSAVVHEYAIAVALGFYKPILFLMFVVPGVLFIYLTKWMKGNRIWNIFMWAMLIVGHGILVALYARAWHIHYNTKQSVNETLLDYFWIL